MYCQVLYTGILRILKWLTIFTLFDFPFFHCKLSANDMYVFHDLLYYICYIHSYYVVVYWIILFDVCAINNVDRRHLVIEGQTCKQSVVGKAVVVGARKVAASCMSSYEKPGFFSRI